MTFKLNRTQLLFASFGISHREPVRKDFVESSPSSRPKFERMQDLELGYSFNTQKTNFSINTFYMAYSNQLVLTGQINDVGAYTRTNAKESYRFGVELMTTHKISDFLKLNGSFSLSQNKIAAFEEYLDNYSAPYSQVIILHKNTDLAFSPSIVANAGFSLSPVKNCSIDWLSKYVGRQFLDNTSNVTRSINPFTFSNTKTFISLYNIKMASKPNPNKKITSIIRSTTTVPISVEMGMLSVLLSTAHLETSPILGNAKLAR